MSTTTTIISAKESRNNMVQIFRAFAIIAVVMIHTTPSGNWQVFCRPFINFSVATFLFLSGYLTKVENDNWSAFYKKRIIRVIIPYIIWTVLYTFASKNPVKLPMNLLTAKSACHMYYIFVYIQFVLLTPLLGKLATSKYMLFGWFVAPVSVLVFKYYWLLTGQNLNPYISLMWGDSCLGWFTFYYLGLVLGNNIIEKRYSLKILLGLYAVSILIQMAEGYWWLSLGERNCGTQLKLSSILTSSVFLLIVYTILKDCRYNIKSNFLRILGDYSFGIYLCHMVMIRLAHFVPYPISSAFIILTSLLFCYIGERACGNKLSRWLGLR